MGEYIILRDISDSDLPLIMAWRSNPLIYQGFYTQKSPLVWHEHLSWWKSRPSSWKQFIITLIQDTHVRDIGVVSIGQMEYWEAEIGIYIGEVTLWGKGYGKQAVKLALDYLREHGFKYTRTTILDNNERSQRLFQSLGYKRIGEARIGESLYRKELK